MKNMDKKSILLLLVVAAFILTAGCASPNVPGEHKEAPQPRAPETGVLKVHFIDVGQADSILAQLPGGQNMLVDAGNNDDGDIVVNYLQSNGVIRIDYLVGTHPHEDHIGGLDTVINNFEIGKIYMPRVTHNTKAYRDVLDAIKNKGLKITPARSGVEILNTGGLTASILSPHSPSYDELNDYSAVIKLVFEGVSFILTGDAEKIPEEEMLAAGTDLKADVLKIGHHGSRTSTTPAFLKAVDPQYAVICAGKDNDYGHPHRETLQKLKQAKVKVYRTDLDGTIIFSSNGKQINAINTTAKST
jgi:beta-lactamase superfamily II metal-dependent hydrolase